MLAPREGNRGRLAGVFVFACLLLATWAADLFVTSARMPRPHKDETPPVILVLPQEPTPEIDDLVLQARIHDATGVGRVVLWTRGERDTEFRAQAMWHVEGDLYMARVEPSPSRGSRLTYFVEATDWLGNGPRSSGSADSPFIARLDRAATDSGVAAAPRADSAKVGMGLALLLLGVLAVLRRQERRDRELEFWVRLLTPVATRRGARLTEGIVELCSRPQHHPRRGLVTIGKVEALRQLQQLRRAGSLPKPPARPTRRHPRSRYDEIRLTRPDGRRSAQKAFWLYSPDEEPRRP